MKCAIYIRTGSKNNQDYHSKRQSDRLERHIAEMSWRLFYSYIDILSKDLPLLLRNPKLSSKMKKLCEMKKIHPMTLDCSINTLERNVDLISLYA